MCPHHMLFLCLLVCIYLRNLKISYTPYSLQFKHPFGLAYGTRTTTEVVYVKLEQGGFTGYGEAALPPYMPENQTTVIHFIQQTVSVLKDIQLPFKLKEIIPAIDAITSNNTA